MLRMRRHGCCILVNRKPSSLPAMSPGLLLARSIYSSIFETALLTNRPTGCTWQASSGPGSRAMKRLLLTPVFKSGKRNSPTRRHAPISM